MALLRLGKDDHLVNEIKERRIAENPPFLETKILFA